MEHTLPDAATDYARLLSAAALSLGVEVDVMLPEDRWFTHDGTRLHFLDWGSAGRFPLVLLHGGGLTAHTWDFAALMLRERYHVIALDQRGHGESDRSPELASYEQDKFGYMLSDLEAFIDRLGYPRVALGGMSLGGATAARYAVRHPERVAALMTVDIYPGILRIGPYRNGRQEVIFASFAEMLARAGEIYARQTPETVRYDVLHNARRTEDGRWTWKEDRRPRPSGDPEEERALWERQATDLEEGLRTFAAPVLILRGGHSRILTPEHAERFLSLAPNGRLVTIPRAGHAIQSHNPRDLAHAIDAFLSEILPESREWT
jgi:pimeloyl-ACP methyl ester carboxylesterase